MNELENSKYLGEEKISKLMLKFSIPCVFSLLVSALYNIVDQIFIGNSELSTLGNAATGVIFPVFVIAQAFAWCFGDGCAAYLNICQGKRDTQNSHKAIGTSITLTIIIGLFLMLILYPLKKEALYLFGASNNTISLAVEYFNIIVAFLPIFMLGNMLNAIIRADGSPSWAMITMIVGAVINIILDPIFIFGFEMGMTGAALATVIGQTVTCIFSVVYFFKSKTFKLTLRSLIPNFKVFQSALKLGASAFITQFTIVIVATVCNMMLSKYGKLSQFGEDIPIAIIGIQSKVFAVVINLVVGVALGCQPIIGYNIGAKKIDRVKKLYILILICTIIIGGVATLLFELAPNLVVGMFGEPTNIPNVDDYWIFGEKIFRIFMSLTIFTCVVKMTSLFFQAAGKPITAVIASVIRDLVCFIPLIIILPKYFGIEGILYAAPVSDCISIIIAVVLTILFFKSQKMVCTDDCVEKIIKESKEGVIITIARQHGSGGKQIGKIVSERLGIPFYYKEVTMLAAEESGLAKEFISDINVNAPSMMHSLYLSTNVIQQAIIAQDKIIRKIADNGSCVIVGRAADYVLRDYKDVVRIFISAPKEYRVKRIMEVYNDSYEEACKNVKHSDNVRSAYYKNISGNEWGQSDNYDLVVDSSIGIEETGELIYNYIEKIKK